MNKFLDWMRYHNAEITWFIIGVLTQAGLENLARGDFGSALFDLGIAFVNYLLYTRN
jgi:hypothetical protein